MTNFPKKPVIFLAFANDKIDNTRYLRNLSVELTGIRKALESAQDAGLCEIVERSNATIEDILDIFESRNFRNRIAIFHYGGHADGYQLLLENTDGSQSTAHGEGLTSYFRKRNNLKIIFLNGCSTEQQAIDLINKGVSCVIATTQSIDDITASDLATRFYKSLARGFSIEKSWEEATDEIRIRKGDNYRALYRKNIKNLTSDRFPWRIFFRKGSGIIRTWNLPDAAENPLFGLPDIPNNYTLPETPFLFLKQYERQHARIFFGRSYYIRALHNLITDEKSPPIIQFYGQSGVGKSSLLEAGLFPRLEKSYTVIYIKRKQNLGLSETLRVALMEVLLGIEDSLESTPEQSLKQIDTDINILRIIQKDLHGQALKRVIQLIQELEQKQERFQQNSHRSQNTNYSEIQRMWWQIEVQTTKPLIILLDQVEEVFTRPNPDFPDEIEDFALQLQDIFGQPDQAPKGKLMLSYRKEFHPEIREILRIKELPRTGIFLEHLTKKEIIEIIEAKTLLPDLKQRYNIRLDSDLSTKIADDLVADKNSPVAAVLQIILTRLWEKNAENRQNGQGTIFSLALYRDLKRKGLAMSEFFDRQLVIVEKTFPQAVQSGLVLDILKHHTTEMLAAESVPVEQLQKLYTHHADILEKLIFKLKEVYLLNDSETEPNATILIHDTLAPIVIRAFNQSDKVGQHASRLLTAKQSNWIKKQEQIWFDTSDLQAVESGISGMRVLSQVEKNIVLQSQKRRNQKRKERYFLASILTLLAASVVILAILFNYQKQKAQSEALANRLTAQALELQETNTTDALRIAEKALKISPKSLGILKVLGKIYAENTFHQHTFHHRKAVQAVEFSPNGKYILVGTEGNIAKLWDLEGNEIRVFQGHTDRISAVAFSADGSKILTGSRDGTAILWNTQGDTLRTFKGHSGEITAVDFSPDDSNILTASTDNFIKIWTQEADLQYNFYTQGILISSAIFSPDGSKILTADFGGTIQFWDKGGVSQTIFDHPELSIFAIDLSPDGKQILVGSSRKNPFLLDLNGVEIRQFQAHQGNVQAVKFSPDGKYIISGSSDRTLILSETQTAKVQFDFRGHESPIQTLAFSRNGRFLATGSEDGIIKLIDNQGNIKQKFTFSDPVITLDLMPKNQLKVIGLKSGDIRIIQENKIQETTIQHPKGILTVKISPDEKFILSGGNDYTARLWNLKTGKLEQVFLGHQARIYSVDFSIDGSKILTASNDHTLKIWKKDGKLTHTITEENDRIRIAKFIQNGQKVISGSWQGILKIRDLDGTELLKQVIHDGKINDLAISSDETLILTAGDDHMAILHDFKGNKLLFLQHPKAVLSVAFSPDNQYLLTGCADNTAILWNRQGQIIFRFEKHQAPVRIVRFSADGQYILTGSEDKSTYLTFTPEAFLNSGKVDKLSWTNQLRLEEEISEMELVKKSNSEDWRELAYFFEKKAVQEAAHTQQILDLKKAIQFYEKLVQHTQSRQDFQETSEVYTKLAELELYSGNYQQSLLYNQKAKSYSKIPSHFTKIKTLRLLAYLQNQQMDLAQNLISNSTQNLPKLFDEWHRLRGNLKKYNRKTDNNKLSDFELFIIKTYQKSQLSAETAKVYALYFREKIKVISQDDYETKLRYHQNYLAFYEQYLSHNLKPSKSDTLTLTEGYIEKGYLLLFNKKLLESKKNLIKALNLRSTLLEETSPFRCLQIAFIYLYNGEYLKAKPLFIAQISTFKEAIQAILAELERLDVRHSDTKKLKKVLE